MMLSISRIILLRSSMHITLFRNNCEIHVSAHINKKILRSKIHAHVTKQL